VAGGRNARDPQDARLPASTPRPGAALFRLGMAGVLPAVLILGTPGSPERDRRERRGPGGVRPEGGRLRPADGCAEFPSARGLSPSTMSRPMEEEPDD
jgi:hypothetical protein